MDINFACQHCGRKLIADETDIGQSVPCPACRNVIVVPTVQPSPAAEKKEAPLEKKQGTANKKKEAPRKRIVMHAPSGEKAEAKAAMTSAGKTVATEAPSASAPPIARDSQIVEVAVGWICIIVGILIEILLPNALLAYLPFFIGAFIMGVILLSHGKIAHGLVMILCTVIPAPLLMHQNVWQGIGGATAPKTLEVDGPRKLVFDASGKPKLVADDRPVAKAPPPPRRDSDEARKQYQSLDAWQASRKAPVKKEPAATSEELSAVKPPPTPGVQDPRDPYRDLLEGTEDIPPLISEEEMARPWSSQEEGFRWQQDTAEARLLPGDPAWVAEVPFVIYSEAGGMRNYHPSGRMGNQTALSIDEKWDVDPHSGRTCIRVSYADSTDWVSAVWQHPQNNWGDMPGGYDLSKASKLTFWAKGESGREEVEFKVGMGQPANAMSRDSLEASSGVIRLREKWRKQSIPLEKLDRSRIISGFIFRIEGQGRPVVFYLDDIQFE